MDCELRYDLAVWRWGLWELTVRLGLGWWWVVGHAWQHQLGLDCELKVDLALWQQGRWELAQRMGLGRWLGIGHPTKG